MASIFTFDPDPPHVSSPWDTPRAGTPAPVPLSRLQAEPQDGPTEYKLHLLLRKRREYYSTSTGLKVAGSYRSVSASPQQHANHEADIKKPVLLQAKSPSTRQIRLEQLTTQLLWRLQQSCPHHSTSASKQVTPEFPDVGALGGDIHIGALVPGLEESLGALYEIGVADDGTFIGLTHDEMDESMQNLRAMAASLGCVVNELRRVAVGSCDFFDHDSGTEGFQLRKEPLWVVEAYVKPYKPTAESTCEEPTTANLFPSNDDEEDRFSGPNQLKVSLTGATMSGKSSLLGCLTTATLDNGRGKSRLNLLKHRHEIVSGMTSSVTQELLGYSGLESEGVHVVNYASSSVASWTDIHSASERIVLVTDSAGHPRYRRTALRGIIGWSPDWTFLCIPADNSEDTSGMVGSTPRPEELLGVASVGVDLSQSHLELCLKLNLRLVIVVTKLDLASKSGLRQSLAKVLSTLKAAGRTPKLLANPSDVGEDLMTIPESVYHRWSETTTLLDNSQLVPIVLTSAVKGTGIVDIHALLSQLPPAALPREAAASEQAAALFHIEDVYQKRSSNEDEAPLPVLSGTLQRGLLKLGDRLFLGPFSIDSPLEQPDSRPNATTRPLIPASRSFPGALNNAKHLPATRAALQDKWIQVTVSSLRHLRLPINTLFAGQVGTVGIEWSEPNLRLSTIVRPRPRKGMVLAAGAEGEPASRRGFVAEFTRKDVDSLSIGMIVVVYIASIRASARVVAGAVPDFDDDALDKVGEHSEDKDEFTFMLDNGDEEELERKITSSRLHVTFKFIASEEYLDVGSQVLVMPGGGPGISGGTERGEKGVASMDAFVGEVISCH